MSVHDCRFMRGEHRHVELNPGRKRINVVGRRPIPFVSRCSKDGFLARRTCWEGSTNRIYLLGNRLNNSTLPIHSFGEGYLGRSEEHTSELQSLMRISYAVFCLKKKKNNTQ